MAKGENIFKRKDGRWEARYIKGRDLSGKAKYGFCYGKTYKEAKEKVTKVKANLLSGKPAPIADSRRCFCFFCDEWFSVTKFNLKQSTCVKYQAILGKHIKPRLGNHLPQTFNEALILEFTNQLLFEDELAPKTVKDILVVLRSVLNYMSKRLPGVVPQIEITYPKESRKEMRVLSRNEQTRFTEYLLEELDDCRFGILLALLTGMRIGELCALRWDNISLGERTITVSATMQRLKDLDADGGAKTKILIGSPKSDTSFRKIPLSDYASTLCERMDPGKPEAYVLTGTTWFMEPRALQYRMKKYTDDCGLEGVHFHTLRHTFATRCIEVGFDVKSLCEIMGHANTSVTLERYVHSSMELKRFNMNKLAEAGL